MFSLHRVLLAVLLVGNTVAFAGVDPVARLVSAIIVFVLVVDLHQVPRVPALARYGALGCVALAGLQLVPLPEALRAFLQPGFVEVLAPGWYPLSLAPWATLKVVASIVVMAGIVLTAARIAATRSGLPTLLVVLTVVCGLVAVLGLAGESGAPEKVMLIRANTGGGGAYGPFVNSNHFAAAIELTLPAALVLLAVALRNLPRPGAVRQRAAVAALAAAVVGSVAVAGVLRSGSRGGVVFIAVAVAVTFPLWLRPQRSRRWPWIVGAVALLAVATALAWTRVPELRDGFSDLLVVDGIEENTRWDLWAGTVRSFARSPVVGSGLGSYRYVIGLDKPATGNAVLEQAHCDWLEWASTSGLMGVAALVLVLVAMIIPLAPHRVRGLRFEFRYPLAGAAVVFAATALHEMVGFGLQIPLNRYLLAVWIGLVLGVGSRVEKGSARARNVVEGDAGIPGDNSSIPGSEEAIDQQLDSGE